MAVCTVWVGNLVVVTSVLVWAGEGGAVFTVDLSTVVVAGGGVVEALSHLAGHKVGTVGELVEFNWLVSTGVVVVGSVDGCDGLVCTVFTIDVVTVVPEVDGHAWAVPAVVVVRAVAVVGEDVEVGSVGEAVAGVDKPAAGADVGVAVVVGGRAEGCGESFAAAVVAVVAGFTVVVTAGVALRVVAVVAAAAGTDDGAAVTAVGDGVVGTGVEPAVVRPMSGPVGEAEGFVSVGALEARSSGVTPG